MNTVNDGLNSPAAALDDRQRTPADTANLDLIRLYAQLNGLSLDAQQLEHYFSVPGTILGMAEMIQALQGLEFEASLQRGRIEQLNAGMLPLLAEGLDGRFMLLGRVEAGSVVVQVAGERQPHQLALTQFGEMWTGRWIKAVRRAGIHEQNRTEVHKFGVGWFWQALRKYRGLMGEVLLASFFVQVFALITPLFFQVVIDKVLTHRSLSTLDVMVVAMVGVAIFEVVLSGMRHYLFSHTTNRIDVELGSKLFRHLMHLPLAFFESRRSGDTVARMRELENARNFLTGQALTSWLDLLFAIVFLGVMFYYSATLTFIVLAALPIFFGASWLITPLLRKKLEDKFALGAENQTFLVETITAMETLKGQAVEPQWQREWERRLGDYVNVAFSSGHLGSATNQFISLTSKLLTVLLLWFGARLVIDGDLTVGGLIAFNMLSGRVNAPILKLASLWQDFTQMKVSIKRLADIMDAPAEPAFQPARATPPSIQGNVSFRDVSFRYRQDGPDVLDEVSFDVTAGEIIGLVGVSGAGKTTLVRLIQRLYTPQRGRILVDGIDLNLVDTSWLRRQIGVVGQDNILFNRSVRDNIALANSQLSMEEIMNAAKLAGAHEFILELPEGYDTVIGERGSKLSGGQRARISIARALATNPRLLLLDEATAALDYESERVIHDNMAEICRGRTVFIVAHRLSTLRLANRILVLERGKVIETGHHQELVSRRGRYFDLYNAHQVLEVSGEAVALKQVEVAHV
ncbi:type I secretion system permease/ATPase [Herbaspirillum sp. WKF16]|uniref:type I secretion system permease/ATPase n=1 Tax=Herbaspirillum sp. WKF16 TaxID=3028312 RepID=UPI0023A989D2|nr:type I secretion system permease/ATPase [Herbaspirillum sp. WKF16]WDZ98131.1 type I secretion system permease/ATPase [Herbaspirillum sp. WKF16]